MKLNLRDGRVLTVTLSEAFRNKAKDIKEQIVFGLGILLMFSFIPALMFLGYLVYLWLK